jgi:phosphate transport system permease protein
LDNAPPEGRAAGRGAPARGERRRKTSRVVDRAFRATTSAFGGATVVLLAAILAILWQQAWPAFRRFGLGFLVGQQWDPVHQRFGALPFIFGTLVTSAIALVLAVPVAIGLAVLLTEFAPPRVATALAVFVDVLAAIPSVVYGLWGLFVLGPFLGAEVEPALHAVLGPIPLLGRLFRGASLPHGGVTFAGGNDVFTAGVVLAIMILPIVTAISREVVAVVPRELREAAKALGATRYEAVRYGVLPPARNGLIGAAILGLGRALGETIAVSMVVGGGTTVSASLFSSGSTIPSVIASQFLNAQGVGLQRPALMALGLLLLLIALLLAASSRILVRRVAAEASAPALAPALEVTG